MNDFAITAATQADIPLLLRMIRELAAFERLDHELAVTEEGLGDALFGATPVAAALMARLAGEPAGYAVYFRTFSTFVGRAGIFLEDLYVRPIHRKRGLGRALLKEVARIGADRDCGRFEWITLRWNENALGFYQSVGAQLLDQWVMLRMSSHEMRQLAGGSP